MRIPILSGIFCDSTGDFRTSLPRNLVPVPKSTGINDGYLRPADGIVPWVTGHGIDRGSIVWRGECYRVSGTKLVRVGEAGAVAVLGDVGGTGPVRLDYRFDRLSIASGGRLYYCDGSALTQVTDSDLGTVVDACWISGYTLATDGTSLIVTELNDPYAVNPLKYGSAEADPDPVLAVARLTTEAYALGRHTIEAFQNVGGELFPFSRIEGAQVPRGVVGTRAWAYYADTIAFVGSGRNEPCGVHLMGPGSSAKLSTREVDRILQGYSEAQLAGLVCEARVHEGHQHLIVRLPDQTLVYDLAASKVLGEPVWHVLSSHITARGEYRASAPVWCYGKWIVGDTQSSAIGTLSTNVSTHWGATTGWELSTAALYNDGNGAILHELELVALTGRVEAGKSPVVWTSYSIDGETWSQERATPAGKMGQRAQRIAWRRLGRMPHYRMQRFRGTSDAHISIARLEARVEPLLTRPGNG
jgi:hypothetical protein